MPKEKFSDKTLMKFVDGELEDMEYGNYDIIVLTVDLDVGILTIYKEEPVFDTITVDTFSNLILPTANITLPNSLINKLGTIPRNYFSNYYLKIKDLNENILIIESDETSIILEKEIETSIPAGTFFSIYISIHTSHNITSEIYNKGIYKLAVSLSKPLDSVEILAYNNNLIKNNIYTINYDNLVVYSNINYLDTITVQNDYLPHFEDDVIKKTTIYEWEVLINDYTITNLKKNTF